MEKILRQWNSLNLDILFQKLMRSHYHDGNHREALDLNMLWLDLGIMKLLDMQPISRDFTNQYNTILQETDKSLFGLLLTKSHNIVKKKQKRFWGWFERNIAVKLWKTATRYRESKWEVKNELEVKRRKKWIKLENNIKTGRLNQTKTMK